MDCPYPSGLSEDVRRDLVDLERRSHSPGLVRELAEIYLESLAEGLAELEGLIARGERVRRDLCLHRLKGSSGTIGALRLMWWVVRLSERAPGEEGPCWAALLAEVEVVRVALRSW
jgi:HPt (histidine-containing phosphotransfer) domain-containing protein